MPRAVLSNKYPPILWVAHSEDRDFFFNENSYIIDKWVSCLLWRQTEQGHLASWIEDNLLPIPRFNMPMINMDTDWEPSPFKSIRTSMTCCYSCSCPRTKDQTQEDLNSTDLLTVILRELGEEPAPLLGLEIPQHWGDDWGDVL